MTRRGGGGRGGADRLEELINSIFDHHLSWVSRPYSKILINYSKDLINLLFLKNYIFRLLSFRDSHTALAHINTYGTLHQNKASRAG